MSTDTNDDLIRVLAARERECPRGADGKRDTVMGAGRTVAEAQAALLTRVECSQCSGSGKVPLLPVLRRECLRPSGSAPIARGKSHPESCWMGCHGLGWLPDLEADTGAIADALVTAGFETRIQGWPSKVTRAMILIHSDSRTTPIKRDSLTFRSALLQAAVAATEAGG